IQLPENAEMMKVMKGGPVDTGRGFVLHSSDFYIQDATLNIDDGISLTATVDILKAIAKGAGPKHAILALGYAGWAPGQLENEIQHN
ncbi:YqgE/AlgH family protein, partial [Acinetobacter baumannii]